MSINWRSIKKTINETAPGYLLAVSGGVDSIFMLDFFRRNCSAPFSVAHFDHRLRPSSIDDANFVERTCRKLDIPLHLGHGDPEKMKAAPSLEAEARRQRYEFFESVLPDSHLIVLGHHANDQAETVLLRLMRGYPDDSLRMNELNGNRFRPFLELTKDEILKQAHLRELEWHDDPTNECLDHERNWVRHILLPQMMEKRNVIKTIGKKTTKKRNTVDTFSEDDITSIRMCP